MSWQAVRWVLNHSEARLGGRLVLLSIAEHADEHGENSWPSMPTIAREARLSVRQVERLIPRLEATPELEVQHKAKAVKGGHRVNVYRLPLMAEGPPDNMSGGESERPDNTSGDDPTYAAATRHPVAPDPTSRSGEPPWNHPSEPSGKNSENGASPLSDDELRERITEILRRKYEEGAARIADRLIETKADGALRFYVTRRELHRHVLRLAREVAPDDGAPDDGA